MHKELTKIAQDTNLFLKNFIKSQKKTELISPMSYGLFSGGKKIRSKILADIGYIFNIDYKTLIMYHEYITSQVIVSDSRLF